MNKPLNPVCTLDALTCEPFKQGTDYESLDAGIAEQIGLTQIGAAYTQVPPGKSSCPFHVHHVEDEMFVILEGEGEYRFGSHCYKVKAGDILGAPRGGPEYAHKLVNTGSATLKYLAISSKSDIEVCEYPDSGKFLVNHRGSNALRYIGRLENALDYWDGEEGA